MIDPACAGLERLAAPRKHAGRNHDNYSREGACGAVIATLFATTDLFMSLGARRVGHEKPLNTCS